MLENALFLPIPENPTHPTSGLRYHAYGIIKKKIHCRKQTINFWFAIATENYSYCWHTRRGRLFMGRQRTYASNLIARSNYASPGREALETAQELISFALNRGQKQNREAKMPAGRSQSGAENGSARPGLSRTSAASGKEQASGQRAVSGRNRCADDLIASSRYHGRNGISTDWCTHLVQSRLTIRWIGGVSIVQA